MTLFGIEITALFLFTQSLALLGTLASLIAPQFKSERHLLMVDIVSGLFWCLHFVFLGGLTGAIICFLGMVRTSICVYLDPKYHRTAVITCLIVMLSAGFLSWGGWYSAMPMIAACLYSFGVLNKGKSTLMRLCVMGSTSCWFVYEMAILAFLAAASSLVIIASGLIGLYRKRRSRPVLQPAE